MGDQPAPTFSENTQISQRCENCSMPRSAFSSRYAGSNTSVAIRPAARPLWRGMPNLVGKSLLTRAITFICMDSAKAIPPVRSKLPFLFYTG